MNRCCDDRKIAVFSLGQLWRWGNSLFLHGYLRQHHASAAGEALLLSPGKATSRTTSEALQEAWQHFSLQTHAGWQVPAVLPMQSLIRFVAVEEASQLPWGFNSRDGNGTDLFKPSQGAGSCTSSRGNDCRRERQNKRTQPLTLPAQKCSSLVVSPAPWPALFLRLPRQLGLNSFFTRMDLLSQLYLNSTCWSFPVNKKGTSVTQTVTIQGHLL